MELVVGQLDHHGIPVLSVAGEADLATAPQLRDAVTRAALEHAGRRLVVDLDGVTFLDSVAIGILLGGARRLRAAGGDLTLVCTSPRLLDLLAQYRVDRIFEIHASVADVAGATHHG